MPEPNIWRTPVIGPWMGRVNSVINIMAMPCTPTPEMWVEAVWHGTPQVMWSLFKPDALDSTFERYQPGARGGNPHHSRRRGKFRAMGVLGTHLPIPKGLGPAMFRLGSLAQKVGWYFMIVDAATQLAVNWSSLAMQYAGCIEGQQGPCQLELGSWPMLSGQVDVPFWGETFDPDGWSTIRGIQIPAGYEADINFQIKTTRYEPIGDPVGSAYALLIDVTSGKVICGSRPTSYDPNTGVGTTGNMRSLSAQSTPHQYRLQIHVSGGAVQLAGSIFSAQARATSKDGLAPDPP